MQKRISPWSARNLILTGLFIALGVLVPFVTGHAAGVPGTVLLPMHLPVLLCGLLTGPVNGLLCGIFAPLLSSFFTGMPPLWPILPSMVCELAAYGAIGGLLYKKVKLPVFAALPLAMLSGRIVSGLAFATINTQPNIAIIAASVWGAAVTGLPGIILQLVLIPILVKALERAEHSRMKPASVAETLSSLPQLSPILQSAVKEIKTGSVSCVVAKDGVIVHTANGRGVSPLLKLYESEEGRATLQHAEVADKIIGKAAAMLLLLGNASYVHGEVMSATADDYLTAHSIPHSYGRRVDILSNRTGNGICPLEKSVFEVDDAEQGYRAIRETVNFLMQEKASNQ